MCLVRMPKKRANAQETDLVCMECMHHPMGLTALVGKPSHAPDASHRHGVLPFRAVRTWSRPKEKQLDHMMRQLSPLLFVARKCQHSLARDACVDSRPVQASKPQ